ncbi:MAG TPA: TadE/TadG family type IV pilus assembly protein [Acetobacteraceae bacterium]|nr:TadE/TadG family type IV pilus assembly protein [Acetobacteraceae bacterium]
MLKSNQRGAVSFEFVLVVVPVLLLIFAIIDLGRYAITIQSLNRLASAGARDVMIHCYSDKVLHNKSPSECSSYTPLPAAADQEAVAPYLFGAGLTPTLAIAPLGVGAKALTITATQPSFTMIMPGFSALNGPSASTSVPF